MRQVRFVVDMSINRKDQPMGNSGQTGGEQPSTSSSKAWSPTKAPVEKDVGNKPESNENDDGSGNNEPGAPDSTVVDLLSLDNQKAGLAQLRELTKAACKVTSRKEFFETLVDWIVTFGTCVEASGLVLALDAALTRATKLHAAAFRTLLRRVRAGEELTPETAATEWRRMCGVAAPLHHEVAAWVPLVINGMLRLAVEQRRALLLLRYSASMANEYLLDCVRTVVFATYPYLRTKELKDDIGALIEQADALYVDKPSAPAVAATTVVRRGAFDAQRGRGGGRGRGSEWQGRCYRCGQSGHFARQCPTPLATVAATNVAPAADSMAKSGQ